MSALSQSFALPSVPSRICLKPSYSPPPANTICQSFKRFGIRFALNNNDAAAAAAHTTGSLPNATREYMAISSPFTDDRSGRRSDPSALASSATATAVVAPDVSKDLAQGIGILNFLEGKSYFITGATGLLAKGKHIGHFFVQILLDSSEEFYADTDRVWSNFLLNIDSCKVAYASIFCSIRREDFKGVP